MAKVPTPARSCSVPSRPARTCSCGVGAMRAVVQPQQGTRMGRLTLGRAFMFLLGGRLAAPALALTFTGSAFLKAKHLLLERDWVLVLPALRRPSVLIALILSEMVLAVCLMTRMRRVAGWGA